ncbi:MAG: FAD-dependent oxidoreductase [bacterium]|nr:FAD-dependent oxidoreductase [bacterium]
MSTISLEIDGREITVTPGTTILTAARALGIRIPTLCHVDGLEPSASCFLCCVQVEGQRTLSPACALPAADGMRVTTDSDDVHASRKMALELLLSDHAGDCVAPCAAQCPAGLDIPGFVQGIAAGSPRHAMEVISDTLSLPGTLGRICPRLCEQHCRRCDHDEGLAIAALHRYATDRNLVAPRPWEPPAPVATGKSVAIVGAGPAGLTAAFYLLRAGHACTLFDAHPVPGGMLRWGIPDYRLPPAALDAEIEVIERLGAELRMSTRWGRDFTLADLRRDHDAVFLGIGAQLSKGLRCEGEELALAGLDFLARVAAGEPTPVGERVIVLGGGNTAMDAARTAIRLGADVRVLYRRTRHEMPCLMEEIEGAEEEGVTIEYLVAPVRLAHRPGSGLDLTCRRMELGEPDDSGRRRPVPVAGSELTLECDTVIAAVGQGVELDLPKSEGLEVTGWGIAADSATLATNLPGVFAGGDAVLGADLAVRAVAAGRLAAASIDQYLNGRAVEGIASWTDVAMRRIDEGERAAIFRGIESSPRVPTATLDRSERLTSFVEIDPGLTAEQAESESRRCLSCGCRKADGCAVRNFATEYQVDPYRFAGDRRRFRQDSSHPEIFFEPGKCIVCGVCVEIAEQAEERLGLAIVGRGFEVAVAVPFDEPLSGGLREVARRCAEACPTGALALRTARACDLDGGRLVSLGRSRLRSAAGGG